MTQVYFRGSITSIALNTTRTPFKSATTGFRNALVIVLLGCISLTAHAQEARFQPTTQIWTDASALGWISPKIKWQADIQYARQSPYYSWNFLQYEQQLTARFWLHYYFNKSMRLSAFGGIWGNQAITDNVNALPHDEQRAAVQLQLYRYPLPNLLVTMRARQEFRDLRDLNSSFGLGIRGRYQVRAHYYLQAAETQGPRYYLIAFNEIFFRHFREAPGASLFDQNRVFLGFGCDINPHIALEMGYFNQFQRARFNPVYDINSALQISLVFDQITRAKRR